MKTFITLIVLAICFVGISSLERKSYLKCGEYLAVNEFLESTNGYYAVMQSDCNFVIYRSKHFRKRNSLWASKTDRNNCKNPILVNQGDGNVVIYNNGVPSSSNAIWSTVTASGTRCYKLIMQDDGNLVLYNENNKAVWSTKTAA